MNAYQRRKYRRALPPISWCCKQGYSGEASYPDLMCTDGYMSDMDADGHDPSTSRMPCSDCKPVAYAKWVRDEQQGGDELPYGLWHDSKGALTFECRACGRDTKWEARIDEFDINNYANVCGGSPRCCP